MQIQHYRALALLLSIAAHIGLSLAVGSGSNEQRSAPSLSAGPKNVIVARLYSIQDAKTQAGATLPVAEKADGARHFPEQETHAPVYFDASPMQLPASREATTSHSNEDSVLLPVLPLPAPYYFPLSELTEKPLLVQDIPYDKLAVLPDPDPQPTLVQLLINENGEIDQVLFEDAALSDEAKRFVSNAFTSVKFRPGKLADTAVKSRLMIEVTLESAKPRVAPAVAVSAVR